MLSIRTQSKSYDKKESYLLYLEPNRMELQPVQPQKDLESTLKKTLQRQIILMKLLEQMSKKR
jgi:hypothetical protein